MSKGTAVVNAAASGIACRSHHTHFADVNPFKRQWKTREEVKAELFCYLSDERDRRRRIASAVRRGARILPTVA